MQLPAHIDPSPCSKVYADGSPGESTVPSFRVIDAELRQVKTLIDKLLAEVPEPVSQLLKSVHICGDTMIRPGLVLLSYRAVSENQLSKQFDAVRIAAIIELIHHGTLLHDDVIDGGRKQREQPTASSRWSNESAVLLGDFLLGQAFKICSDLDPEISNIIARSANRICEGRLRQITERQNWQLSESEYIDIITERSAALFSSCCLLGGLLGGASETQVQSLSDFGLNTGIAFQITDDLPDMIGDESKTVKTDGIDVNHNRLTLAVIHLLRAVDKKERDELINSFLVSPVSNSVTRNNGKQKGGINNKVNRGPFLDHDAECGKDSLAEMLKRMGSLEYAQSRVQEFITKALNALTDLKEGPAKNALIQTAKFVGRRAI
ncbi:MAG: polyprenyl synthetase family protein [Planctomycetota bacterium]|jgi:octaprenyl-diphosphate synthase